MENKIWISYMCLLYSLAIGFEYYNQVWKTKLL